MANQDVVFSSGARAWQSCHFSNQVSLPNHFGDLNFFQTLGRPSKYLACQKDIFISSGMNIVFEVADPGHGLVFQNLAYYG